MASLSNINGLFDVHSTGAILFSTSHGTSGQILKSNGNAAPTWVNASTVIGGPYLPLSGGTLTGATATASGISFTVGGTLTGTTATFSANVGIGETNPTYKFEVRGSGTNTLQRWTTTEGGALLLIPANDAANPDWTFIAGTNEDIQIDPANNDSGLIVKYNGNVGIGVTGPLSPLSIQANSGGSALRFIGRSDGISGIDFFNSTQTVGNYLQSNGTWIRSRADGGFHFSKGSTPITTDVDGFTIEGMNVGIGLIAPAAKLHVEGRNASNVINAQMLIGYSGNSQNFFDADSHYFRNSAFVNILQLGADTILGTPNNTQRLRITTDYSQIGPLTVKYPYYRVDSFRSDGSGYFWAFGHEKSDGTQSIGMMLNDGVSGNKYTRIINTLEIASFTANEYNGAYPSFQTNVVLRNSGNSYLNGGNIGIGTTSPGEKLDVVGSGKFQPGIADGDALVTIAQTNTNAYVHAGIKINAGNTNPFYIYQSGSSNTLRFNYNSLADAGGQLVITDSGNVGIGTASPTMKLHIAESKAGNIGVTVQNTNSSYSSQIRFLNSVGTEKSALTFVPSDTSLRFFHNGSDRMTITSGGQVTIGTTNTAALLNVGGPILASDNNQSSGMYVRRTLNLTHPGNTGTFTRTFNPVTQFGISRLGGNVLLEVSGWSQKVNCGYIQFQNAGGGGNLTTVSYTQIAVSGTGSISVSINSANDNSIDINFSGWHGNSHAWQAKIITQ